MASKKVFDVNNQIQLIKRKLRHALPFRFGLKSYPVSEEIGFEVGMLVAGDLKSDVLNKILNTKI